VFLGNDWSTLAKTANGQAIDELLPEVKTTIIIWIDQKPNQLL
jgi:hypothetical protein